MKQLFKKDVSVFHISHYSNNKHFHIAAIGAIGQNKGRRILYSLTTSPEFRKMVKWSVFGETDLHNQPGYYSKINLNIHGRYHNFNELRALVEREKVNLIIFPAICPETYSFTLSEVWQLGIPVLVSNLGALKERVERYGGGWVVNKTDLDGFKEKIFEILSSPEDYSIKKQEVLDISLRSISEMANDYKRLYLNCIKKQIR